MPEETLDFTAELAASSPNLRRYARSLLHDANAADDLVQDCLERALERRHLWRSGGSLRPWLFRIMHNLYANQVRRERSRPRIQALDCAPDVPGPSEAHASRVAIRELETALGLLPPSQREIVLLVALSGMSYEKCADILDVPVGTVMSRLFRGRERLRELLDGENPPHLRRIK